MEILIDPAQERVNDEITLIDLKATFISLRGIVPVVTKEKKASRTICHLPNDENPYRWIAITQDGANGQIKAIQNSR
jgi:hypothetical protein